MYSCLEGPSPRHKVSLLPHTADKKQRLNSLCFCPLCLAAAAAGAARQRTTTMSMATAPPPQTLIEEQANEIEGGRNQQIPEDGHTWKKYGQKFIRSIQKIRCYFKCQRATCIAKKKVEWPPTDPSNLIVTYEGHHNHPSNSGPHSSSSQQDGSDPRVNDYNLLSQVLGATNNCS
ncbi:hypothetical protein MRB53_018398 [Persea americana]|uniref:Uncharacterized protein n=1 Tax=Persea americana TaxID=3435 RepID=A0ACC2M7W5_PERAE|nr:hypothetical protein MRB53_018398 [Persea americana]